MRFIISVLFASVSIVVYAQAPSTIKANDVVFVEDSDFGQALAGAILKKKVPVLVTTARDKATFFMEETSLASKEGTAERVTKVLAFGVFAGSGKSYEASVKLSNADGIVLFAHNTKKGDVKGAADDVANKLKDHIKNQGDRKSVV